jgi:hypothetical protein
MGEVATRRVTHKPVNGKLNFEKESVESESYSSELRKQMQNSHAPSRKPQQIESG